MQLILNESENVSEMVSPTGIRYDKITKKIVLNIYHNHSYTF